MRLYEISQAYRALLDHEPEQGSDLEADWLELLDTIEGSLQDKAQNIGLYVRELTAEAEAVKAEEQRLTARRRALENKADRLREYLERELTFAGIDKVKTELVTVSIQSNPPSVEITGEVPAEYLVAQEPKVDKRGILEALKAGQELSFAQITQGRSLRIK
jgi:hypothetical protein